MNLTGRPPYQKSTKPKSKKPKMRNRATAAHRRYWSHIAKFGCMVEGSTPCRGRITIHHCGTGAGGRKDHYKVIPLCWWHHQGAEGIEGKRMSKREWQQRYKSEEELLKLLDEMLGV